jgi:hypothetical protein
MCRTWPFKKAKNDDKAMPSMAKQKKERDWPYMNVDMAMALHHQNMSVGGGTSTSPACGAQIG